MGVGPLIPGRIPPNLQGVAGGGAVAWCPMGINFNPIKRFLGLLGGLALGLSLACGKSDGPKDPLTYYSHHHPAHWVDDGTIRGRPSPNWAIAWPAIR